MWQGQSGPLGIPGVLLAAKTAVTSESSGPSQPCSTLHCSPLLHVMPVKTGGLGRTWEGLGGSEVSFAKYTLLIVVLLMVVENMESSVRTVVSRCCHHSVWRRLDHRHTQPLALGG